MTDCTNEPTEGANDVFDVDQAAEYLGVSTSTVVRAVHREQLKPREGINTALARQPRYTFERRELDEYRIKPKARKPRKP